MAVALLALMLASCSTPGGREEVVLDLLLTDDTVYAPGYTDDRFNSITVGMTEGQVIGRLGPPVDEPYYPQLEDQDWDKGLRWTKSAHDSHYKVRAVLFRNGRVSKKFAEFYVD